MGTDSRNTLKIQGETNSEDDWKDDHFGVSKHHNYM